MPWNKPEVEGNRCEPVVQTCHGFHWYVKPTGVGNRAGVLRASTSEAEVATYSHRPLFIQRGLPIPLDQPLARRACACAGLAHSAPRSRTWSSTTPNGARGVQSLWTWSATPRASAALAAKGRHSQPPTQHRFVQDGPVSSCRSHLRARGRCCAHRARPAHRTWSDGV